MRVGVRSQLVTIVIWTLESKTAVFCLMGTLFCLCSFNAGILRFHADGQRPVGKRKHLSLPNASVFVCVAVPLILSVVAFSFLHVVLTSRQRASLLEYLSSDDVSD